MKSIPDLYVANSAKSDSAFPLIFLTKMFVGYALTPSLTSSADPVPRIERQK